MAALRLARASCRFRSPCFRGLRSTLGQRKYLLNCVTKGFPTSAIFESNPAPVFCFIAFGFPPNKEPSAAQTDLLLSFSNICVLRVQKDPFLHDSTIELTICTNLIEVTSKRTGGWIQLRAACVYFKETNSLQEVMYIEKTCIVISLLTCGQPSEGPFMWLISWNVKRGDGWWHRCFLMFDIMWWFGTKGFFFILFPTTWQLCGCCYWMSAGRS